MMKIRKLLLQICYLIGALLIVSEVPAEDSSCLAGSKGADTQVGVQCLPASSLVGKLDLTAPANPLFALMGGTPDTVIKPVPGEQISAAIIPNLVNASGDEQTAFALEFRPALFIMPERYTVQEFWGAETEGLDDSQQRVNDINQARAWSPVSLHFALMRGTDVDQSTKVGFGAQYNFDSADPMFDDKFGTCAKQATAKDAEIFAEVNRRARDENLTEVQEQQLTEELFAKVSEDAFNECAKKPWNRRIGVIGVSGYYIDSGATPMMGSDDDNEPGVGVWASYALPLGLHGQLLASVKYNENLITPIENGGSSEYSIGDVASIGARYTHHIIGTTSGTSKGTLVRGFIEAGYTDESSRNARDDEYWQAGIGAEIRLKDDLYFQVLFGDTFGSNTKRDTYLNGQFKWSFSSELSE